ncbi:MAG: hypothetical protein AAF371_01130 [Pseudomonadota bacterium]
MKTEPTPAIRPITLVTDAELSPPLTVTRRGIEMKDAANIHATAVPNPLVIGFTQRLAA